VNVFSNRVEISNPGNLPPGITIDTIRDSQFSRNQFIASILRNLEFLEEYGRGIDIVYAAMDAAGLLPPIFKNSTNSFKVILLGGSFKDLNQRQVEIWHKLQEVARLSARQMVDMFPATSRPTINNDIRKLVDTGLIVSKGSGYNTYYEAKF
jgi:ATP-dependent DNA helicase RecG